MDELFKKSMFRAVLTQLKQRGRRNGAARQADASSSASDTEKNIDLAHIEVKH